MTCSDRSFSLAASAAAAPDGAVPLMGALTARPLSDRQQRSGEADTTVPSGTAK